MLDSSGVPRPPYLTLHDTLASLSVDDFDRRCAVRDRAFRDQGITFSLSGEERPFPLDLVPRVVSADEWSLIEAGVTQRVKALDAFLAYVYGPGNILPDGVAPRRSLSSRRACTTRRTSSTPSWLDRWASSSSRVATSYAATTSSTCGVRRASSASTSCTGASTTTTSTPCTSVPTPSSAAPAFSTRRAPATCRSPMPWATASPTTSSSAPTCRR